MTSKACIVHTPEFDQFIPSIIDHFHNKGFNVCIAAANKTTAESAKAGDLSAVSPEVKACLENADICIFLVPEKKCDSIENAANYASKNGNLIVAVAENTLTLPKIFDDLAHSIVGKNSPQLTKALDGDKVWEAPQESPNGRKIPRVKCQ